MRVMGVTDIAGVMNVTEITGGTVGHMASQLLFSPNGMFSSNLLIDKQGVMVASLSWH